MPASLRRAPPSPATFITFNVKLLILNTHFIVFNTKFLVFNAQSLVLNTKFIIFTHVIRLAIRDLFEKEAEKQPQSMKIVIYQWKIIVVQQKIIVFSVENRRFSAP